MNDRQRGAAQVPVIVFLLTLIVLFGALGFGYVQMEKNSELETAAAKAVQDLKAEKAKTLLERHYREAITKVVGEAGEYAGRDNFKYEGNPSPLQNVSSPKAVFAAIEAAAAQLNVTATEGVAAFFGRIKAELDAKNARVAALESEQTKLEGQIVALQTSIDTAKGERTQEVASLNSQLETKDREYQSTIDVNTQTIAKQVDEYSSVREQLTEAREAARAEASMLTKELETMSARAANAASKVRLVNPPQVADGQIIEASKAAGRAWINIGRNDMLPVGTTFRITNPDQSDIKAYGTVTRVEADRAELVLSGVKDAFDYPRKQDEVKNDLYSPNIRRTIFLMGRFGYPHSKSSVKNTLERLGNTVVDKLAPTVDLVILGNDEVNEDASGYVPVTETKAFQEVAKWNIETATLNKIKDFLKLSD